MMQKLLVANRGEIARRVMRSAHAMGIACVAVHSDADAGAPHVAEAEEAVRLPGERASDTYLRSDSIVEAALAARADAVHPGYGFLSEDARFARACEEAGLVFVGPPSAVIEAMGSKLGAKRIMAAAGVPVLPTVEVPAALVRGAVAPAAPRSGAETQETGLKNRKPKEAGSSFDALVESAGKLGWPVLVKASAGGGGRGMRVVETPDKLADSLASAGREAGAAFGDETVFLEPYVLRPRHVEVQIFGDAYGTVVHLFERECSIQRRHQKIVEESPSPGIDPLLRAELGEAALRAARAIGYVNAGTVEFLLREDRSFAFLEVNARLQVEHTVTECVTGLDLVRLQLLVADGMRLPPEVLEAQMHGHAIEVRIYAEDPTDGWKPSVGRIHRFSVPGTSANESATARTGAFGGGYRNSASAHVPDDVRLRLDSGVEDGSEISPYYDPMMAKLIAYAPTRREAARALAGALERAAIHGVRTNRDLLVRTLRHSEFLDGDADTGFLDRHDPSELGAPLATREAECLHALAAALCSQAARREQAPVLGDMPSGWRNVPGPPQTCSFEGRSGPVAVEYLLDRRGRLSQARVDGEDLGEAEIVSCTAENVVISMGGVEKPYLVHLVGSQAFVDGPDGSSSLTEIERFPAPSSQIEAGALSAPLPGTVVKVAVTVGAKVESGDVLVAIEAMKMEHEVRAKVTGTVSAVHVSAGEQVEAGTVLVVVDEAAESGTAADSDSDSDSDSEPASHSSGGSQAR